MYIDSHCHYSHRYFDNSFTWLSHQGEHYVLGQGTREDLFRALEEGDIRCSIEPGISLASNEAGLALCRQYPGRVFTAVGVHPTRIQQEVWGDRVKLRELARGPGIVAIGETGLDYHHPRKDQKRLRQMAWFVWQLELARKRDLPLILHIRDADRDAIRILKRYRGRLRGGVVHCFTGDWDTARQYLDLGFHLGIGGSLLHGQERSHKLCQAVQNAPLDRLLLETDGPYVLPDCNGDVTGKARKRSRNSSLILPQVARKIAQLKGISLREVEDATAKNAIDLFSLPL